MSSVGHCVEMPSIRAICLLKAILLLILYFLYMKIWKKIGFHFFFVQNPKWQPCQNGQWSWKLTENNAPVFYGFQVGPYDFHRIWRRDYLSFLRARQNTAAQFPILRDERTGMQRATVGKSGCEAALSNSESILQQQFGENPGNDCCYSMYFDISTIVWFSTLL